MTRVNELLAWGRENSLVAALLLLVLAFLLVRLSYRLLFRLVERVFQNNYLLSVIRQKCYRPGLITLQIGMAFLLLTWLPGIPNGLRVGLEKTFTILLIGSVTFLLIRVLAVVKAVLLRQFDTRSDNDLHARKVYTQFQILERITIFLLVISGAAIALMSFDSIRQIGVSLLASAGLVGIILGFAAQKSFATIFAGIQIAIAQPIRLDDVVVVEGEWGRIEEIMLTYVAIRLWDNRRLIVPVNYFLDKPFQNWTRSSSQITGSVFLFVDYAMPIRPLRDELDRILADNPLWDGEVKVLQVTDSTERAMQLRVLVSAETAPKVWDLRCDVREKLIDFMQKHYGSYLPKNRWEIGVAAPGNSSPNGLSGAFPDGSVGRDVNG
ncbi:MAG: mechanosensitive ion channel [Ferruginibacter sp.]|nr:mechanosensitive ion channel [Cytophagales bacterium]